MANEPEEDLESPLDAELKRIARDASRHSVSDTTRIENLEHRVDKLNLIVESLWQLVAQQASLSEEELLQALEGMIAQRGEKDAKTLACRSCNRLVASNNGLCMYCGARLTAPGAVSLFERSGL